ncbi:hypothetical protein E0Z10_g5733 [Xylaria hypoxylon]|uniref:Uncharacterized protein n=1 Tax=Xylaria hypoxylon TaxID=37992 RepID=A0A4Z0YFE0_9PEZI|nr:hypothetical protein E0Z10_g5733 [Xylaria hypoxylon]
MAPSAPSTPGARDKRGSRRGLSSTYDTAGAQASGIRGCREVGVRPGQRLATREAVKEVIVIDSDSDSYSYSESGSDDGDGDSDGIGSSAEPAPAPAPAPLPLPVPAAGSSLKRVPVEGRTDRTSTADLLTPQRQFSGFWDLVESKTPTKKIGSQASGPSGLFVTNTNTPSRAPRGSLGSTYARRPTPSGKVAGVKDEKTDIKVTVSRQKPAASTSTTTTTAVTTTRNGTLPRHSSPVLPPTMAPAVKARVYSAPRPGPRRNINSGSKKLEAFGFVSAASLLAAGTATVTTRNAGAITPTPILKPSSISQPIAKPIKKEAFRPTEVVRAQPKNLQSPPRTTHDTSTAITPVPIAKPIHRDTIKVEEASNLRPLPRTPENTTAAKRAAVLSSSIGTYGDPYAISSDSDSDDDGNGELRSVLSVKSLNSFAETAGAHETASDVEAVLNQFPAWLDSPIPPGHRSSYLATSTTTRPTANARPATIVRSSKRLWDYGDKNESREGKEKRRIIFAGGDGFSPSPVPTKRAASPIKRITSTEQIAILGRSSPAPARQVASHIERINGPVKKITAFGVNPNSSGHINLNSNYNHNHNHNHNHNQEQDQDQDHRVIRENTPPPKEKGEKKKKKKKRKVRSSGNKTSCRYRNHNRETWRPKKRRKVKRESI